MEIVTASGPRRNVFALIFSAIWEFLCQPADPGLHPTRSLGE